MVKKKTKRQRQAEQTKWNIYNCAHKLFQEKSFEEVTIEEIAEAAGVSVGLFYYYFRNKHEILAIYHEKMDDLYLDYYKKLLADKPNNDMTHIDMLEDMILYICEACVARGVRYIRVVYPYMLVDRDFGRAMIDPERPYFSIMNEFFSNGQQQGEISREIDSAQLVADITKVIRGCIVDWCINGGEESIGERSRSIIEIFLRGIAPKQ